MLLASCARVPLIVLWGCQARSACGLRMQRMVNGSAKISGKAISDPSLRWFVHPTSTGCFPRHVLFLWMFYRNITAVAFSHRVVSAGEDNAIRIWDLTSFSQAGALLPAASGHAAPIIVRPLSISPSISLCLSIYLPINLSICPPFMCLC